jgi:hypothetical protein
MTPSSNHPEPRKAAVCIKEMAALVGLSRQRFMQLVKAGVFPAPLRDQPSGRPYYTDEMQATCLEVRRRNCGINGRVVMFYARRAAGSTTTRQTRPLRPVVPKPAASDRDTDITEGLHGLGLLSATTAQVANAVTDLFPQGMQVEDAGHVIRAIFLHLRGKNPAEKVGRKD